MDASQPVIDTRLRVQQHHRKFLVEIPVLLPHAIDISDTKDVITCTRATPEGPKAWAAMLARTAECTTNDCCLQSCVMHLLDKIGLEMIKRQVWNSGASWLDLHIGELKA